MKLVNLVPLKESLQVTTNNGKVAIISDPKDIKTFYRGGTVFGDDSVVLVDGINSKIVGPVETTTLKTTSTVTMSNLPTSDAGLAVGQLWNDSGTVKVKQ